MQLFSTRTFLTWAQDVVQFHLLCFAKLWLFLFELFFRSANRPREYSSVVQPLESYHERSPGGFWTYLIDIVSNVFPAPGSEWNFLLPLPCLRPSDGFWPTKAFTPQTVQNLAKFFIRQDRRGIVWAVPLKSHGWKRCNHCAIRARCSELDVLICSTDSFKDCFGGKLFKLCCFLYNPMLHLLFNGQSSGLDSVGILFAYVSCKTCSRIWQIRSIE